MIPPGDDAAPQEALRSPPQTKLGTPYSAATYIVLLIGAVELFLVIDSWGRPLTAPRTASHAGPAESPAAGKPDAVVHVLIALTAVVVVGRLLGAVFGRLGQPPVIGEVVGGIALG